MKIQFRRQIFCWVVLWLSAPAHADIYKWVDKDGNLHFGDRPPTGQRAQRRESAESASSSASDAQSPAAEGKQERTGPSSEQGSTSAQKDPLPKNARVEMYTTSWCGYCKKAREYFNARGILFTDYDIEKDPAAMERRVALGSGKSVPVVIINGTVIQGFSASRFEAALRRQ